MREARGISTQITSHLGCCTYGTANGGYPGGNKGHGADFASTLFTASYPFLLRACRRPHASPTGPLPERHWTAKLAAKRLSRLRITLPFNPPLSHAVTTPEPHRSTSDSESEVLR